MRKLIITLISIVTINFFCYSQSLSDGYVSITTNKDYIITKMYFDGNLIPIGWSRDGKVAYVQFIGFDLNGLVGPVNISSVNIMDLITDQIVDVLYTQMYSLDYSRTEKNEILYNLDREIIRLIEDDDKEGISFHQFWELFEPEITHMLERHRIISYPNPKFYAIDTLKNNYGLEIYFEDFRGRYADSDYGSEYQNIIVKNSTGKTKTIGQVGSYMSGGTALGYYKSPYDNRIVIYIEEKGHDLHRYHFYGCHLTAGFQ